MKSVFLFILSFTLSMLCLELYVRLSGISLPSYVYDDKRLGRDFNPNHDIFEARAEGFCIDHVNKYGYFGETYPPEKDNNSIRIALLGSSYVEGLQVFLRNRFSYIFEKKLSEIMHHRVEVLNFAIGGDDFRGMYIRYQGIVKKFNPDYTLFMVKPSDFSRKKAFPSPELITVRDTVKISYAFLKSSDSELRQEFRFLRKFGLGNFLKEAYEVYYDGRLPEVLLDKLDFIHVHLKSSEIQGGPYSYFNLNEFVFNELNRENHFSNDKNIIVDIDGFQRRYKKFCNEIGLPQIELFNDLNQYSQKQLKYWKASKKMGHWNNFANKVVGHLLAKKMAEFILNNK